jgi:hypothetical protein
MQLTSRITIELRIIYGSIYYSYLVRYKINKIKTYMMEFSHFSNRLCMHRLYCCVPTLNLKLLESYVKQAFTFIKSLKINKVFKILKYYTIKTY